MNLLIMENSSYCLTPFINTIKGIPNSSKITINNRNFFNCLDYIKHPPVLSKRWLCIIDRKLPLGQMKTLLQLDNINLIYITSKNQLEDMSATLKTIGVPFKIFNNLEHPKEVVIKYVCDELKIDSTLAEYLCNRHRMYLPKIIDSVNTLYGLDVIDKKAIQTYTTRNNNVWISSLTDHLLGIDSLSNKKIAECLHTFKYGFEYVIKTIIKELELYEYVFDEIYKGNLTLENYLEFEGENKKFNSLANFKKKKMVTAYEIVSFDKLYFLKLQVEQIQGKQSCIYKLIKLLGVV